MNERIVTIGGLEIKLNASALTLIQYKKITGNDYYADRLAYVEESLKSLELERKSSEFIEKYSSLTDSDFNKLPNDEQIKYWDEYKNLKTLANNINIDNMFTFNVFCAMAYAGGYKGDYYDLLSRLEPYDFMHDDELINAVAELAESLSPPVKKKD